MNLQGETDYRASGDDRFAADADSAGCGEFRSHTVGDSGLHVQLTPRAAASSLRENTAHLPIARC